MPEQIVRKMVALDKKYFMLSDIHRLWCTCLLEKRVAKLCLKNMPIRKMMLKELTILLWIGAGPFV